MENKSTQPQFFNLINDEALEITHSSYGSVGHIFTGGGLEAVWVKKEAEEIDPGWFEQPTVDMILVVQGNLKVEFEQPGPIARVLKPGEMLILPPNICCRAYRWPREAKDATIFLAVYPSP